VPVTEISAVIMKVACEFDGFDCVECHAAVEALTQAAVLYGICTVSGAGFPFPSHIPRCNRRLREGLR
jgi:uncharacterized protein YbbK (DUF523 family)